MADLELEVFWDGTESELNPDGLQNMLLDIGKDTVSGDEQRNGEPGSMQRMASTIVNNSTFERANGMVILANSVFIALQMNVTAENLREAEAEGYSEGWRDADYCFTAVFVFELLVRMVAERQRFFTGHSKRWNMFDLVMVFLAILEESLSLVPSSGVIHVLRFLRFVRLASFARFFREERMFWGRMHTIAFLVWASLLLVWVICLLLLTHTVSTALDSNELSELEIVSPLEVTRPQYV